MRSAVQHSDGVGAMVVLEFPGKCHSEERSDEESRGCGRGRWSGERLDSSLPMVAQNDSVLFVVGDFERSEEVKNPEGAGGVE